MTKEQVHQLTLPQTEETEHTNPTIIETHISWLLFSKKFVFKIKKPIVYSFLDFSTLAKRKYYCEREIALNQRLTEDIYIDVQPIIKSAQGLFIGAEPGTVIDYAVKMNKQDHHRQMDVMLRNGTITNGHTRALAETIVAFHRRTEIVYEKNPNEVHENFLDLNTETFHLEKMLGIEFGSMISKALGISTSFTKKHHNLLTERIKDGFYRDCHGDLHSRNIFLLQTPQPFDCIEFNDEFRKIDVLNEIAFLCMDLDSFGRQDLSSLIVDTYNNLFPAIRTEEERQLFIYYKSYRANIRAKVNSLRARSASVEADAVKALTECKNYLYLMQGYLKQLK